MKKLSANLIALLTLMLLFFQIHVVLAAEPGSAGFAQPGSAGSAGAPVSLTSPIGKDVTPQVFIGRIINAALGIVGSLALLMFVYGGFVWLTSAGSADKVGKGKNILVWATIGLATIFLSYAAVRFVISRVAT